MTKQSQGPPRMMTIDKEQHIRKFIDEGLESNIIRASNAVHYSQVHLVAKPMNEQIHKKTTTAVASSVPKK